MPSNQSIIEQAIDTTIQDRVRKPVTASGVSVVHWLARAGLYIAPWWSPARDKDLRRFWKKSDHLAGAIYSYQAKMTAIPSQVIPRDPSIREHVKEAQVETERIQATAQFGEGWESYFSKWVEDFLCQDAGAYTELIGAGPVDGPLIGRPISFAHLDSNRCQRTGNAEFPVLYTDDEGKQWKVHFVGSLIGLIALVRALVAQLLDFLGQPVAVIGD
ncbi:hypothetical protein LCGC14_2312740, partial [marine sediment metagenome]